MSLSRRSIEQRVIGLVFITRAGLGLKARDQAETLDPQGIGTELRVGHQKRVQLVEWGVAKPRQSDVRRKFARLRRKADADRRLLALVAQPHGLGAALASCPQAR